ncbi:MAG: gas vesicle protein K [Gemmatimonadetes bacterium]|nr:gas vesicle protein K [Gemmatimonadota bacterium]
MAESLLERQVTLLETLDRVLNRGVVVAGDVTLSVADVDLIHVGLRLLLCSVETAREWRVPSALSHPHLSPQTSSSSALPPPTLSRPAPGNRTTSPTARPMSDARWDRDDTLRDVARELGHVAGALPRRIDASPDQAAQGLAKLVLTLIELLRRLLERQAVRRIEAGSLSPEEIERMGVTFMRLEERMAELKAHFGLSDDDLNLSLGPLGDLM